MTNPGARFYKKAKTRKSGSFAIWAICGKDRAGSSSAVINRTFGTAKRAAFKAVLVGKLGQAIKPAMDSNDKAYDHADHGANLRATALETISMPSQAASVVAK